MSNDTKFWVARVINFLALGVIGTVLMRFLGEVMKASDPHATAHPMLWFCILLLVITACIPLAIWHRQAKAARYDPTMHKTQDQIDVETLSAYVSQEQAAKRATATDQVKQKPPTSGLE